MDTNAFTDLHWLIITDTATKYSWTTLKDVVLDLKWSEL